MSAAPPGAASHGTGGGTLDPDGEGGGVGCQPRHPGAGMQAEALAGRGAGGLSLPGGRQTASHCSRLSKRLRLPPQPPYQKSEQRAGWRPSKNHLGEKERQGPASRASRQAAARRQSAGARSRVGKRTPPPNRCMSWQPCLPPCLLSAHNSPPPTPKKKHHSTPLCMLLTPRHVALAHAGSVGTCPGWSQHHRNTGRAPCPGWGHPMAPPHHHIPEGCPPSPTGVHAGADAVPLAAEAVGVAPAAPVPEGLAGPRLPLVVPHDGEAGAGAAGVLVQGARSGDGHSPPALAGTMGCRGHPGGGPMGTSGVLGGRIKANPPVRAGPEDRIPRKRRCSPPCPPTGVTGDGGMRMEGTAPVMLTHCTGVPGGGSLVPAPEGRSSWGHPGVPGRWLLSTAEQKE